MADIYGTSFALADTFQNGDQGVAIDDVYNGATAVINGVTYLYVPSYNDDKLDIFTVSEDGVLTYQSSITDTPALTLDAAGRALTFQSGGTDLLVVAGIADDGISVFTLSDTAPFATLADTVFDSENVGLEINGAWDMAVYETSSSTFLYVAGSSDNGVSVFSVASNGTLSNIQNVADADNPEYELGGTHISPVFELFGTSYVIVTGESDDGFSVFSLSSTTGQMTYVASFADPVTLNGAYRPSGVEIDGKGYIYVPSDDADTISVYSLNVFTSTLTQEQVIQSPTTLGRAAEGSLVQLGDTLIYAVAAFDSDQVHIYEVETNGATGNTGQLTLVQTLTDNQGEGELNFPRMGDPFTIGDKTFVVVGALSGDAINIYEVGGGDDVLDGTQGGDNMFGGSGDDVINGYAGDDEIRGDTGTDIINAGSGSDLVHGSIGNDSSNGGSGYDGFDMRFFNGEATGVTVDMFNQKVVLPGGSVQFATGFERIWGTNQDDTLVGNEDNNDLRGEAGDDVLRGREGNDYLRGGNGNDQLVGGDGDDVLLGQGGNDANMNGGNGDDTLDGSTGNDGLFGGFGADDLTGGSGDDSLRGNEGDDDLFGGADNDDLRGGDGVDFLVGGLGDDFIFGDAGDDEILGEEGSNTMTGGAGADAFLFAASSTDGYNTIKDWTNGFDSLGFNGFGTEAQILSGASQRSWGVRIDLNNGQTIALEGATLGDLGTEDIFLFSF